MQIVIERGDSMEQMGKRIIGMICGSISVDMDSWR